MKGMSMQNVVAGFHTTGVYPFNRSVVNPSKESNQVSLAEKTGLWFIPLYSLARKPDTQPTALMSFSPEEIARFRVSFEEGS